MHVFQYPLWSRFVSVARPFFVSEARSRALGILAIMVALLLTVNGLNLVNSYVMRDFMTALVQRHTTRFFTFGLLLAGVFGIASIIEAFSFFAEQRLGLFWRDWLTRRLLDRYLAHQAYHRLTINQAIDNPDQRISEDIKTFTTSSLSFIVLIVNGLLTLLAFLGVLWSISPWLVLTAVLYAAFGSLGTILLGRRLVPLNNLQLQKEADFRFALGRIREQANAAPSTDGRSEEKTKLLDRLSALVANFRDVIKVTRNVGFFTKEYNYLIQIIPALVVAPLYIRGSVDFGTIPQSAMAFGQVLGAFSLIVTKYQELSAFAAVVNRLGSMWEATASEGLPAKAEAGTDHAEADKAEKPSIERITDNERISYEALTLWTPRDKRVLVHNLTLEVPEGKRLLVTGPTGSGKTALCLATAGLWGAGQGKVRAPQTEQTMILPQQLYTATGRLRDLLLAGRDCPPTDEEQLRAALRSVGLDYLAEQQDGLDSEWDWPNDLSAGDQHALALARLLLAQPRIALLDGVPWSLTPARQQRLYAALARTATTYISFADSAALLPYHDFCLELLGDGKWRLRPADSSAVADGKETELVHSQAIEKGTK